MTVTQNIFEIMRNKCITLTQLSKSTGIPVSTISSWKQRNSCPASNKLPIIAECLGVELSDLIGGSSSVNIANNNSNCSVSINNSNSGCINLNNEFVAKAYENLSEKEKLSVQMFILETAEKSEKSNATVNIIR